MKKLIVPSILLLLAIAGAAYYFELGVSRETKRDRYLANAKAYIEAAKPKEAIIELKNALKSDPAHAESHYQLGVELLKVGDSRAAYNEFVRAKDLDPKLIKARHQLGVMYLLTKDLSRAKEE
jgi:Flp pilus assembly protein TadD